MWDFPPKDEVVFILGFLMAVVLLVCLGWRRETRKRWKGNEEQESGRHTYIYSKSTLMLTSVRAMIQ